MTKALVIQRRNGLLKVVIGPREGECLQRWRHDCTGHHVIVDVDFKVGDKDMRTERQMFHADEVSRIFLDEL